MAAGDSVEDVLDGYPTLSREDVLACLQYASKLAAHRFTLVKSA
ncbi:hypothetical protein BOO71_0002044 [Deinococcus marmoris]|uniref:DUF433 domain-containing protein n=1 Tax=Deinococcus marmoris TaxID=249408 RepID=A0A1U7P3E9_9DEIO|nr:hypothetical protein BOO71_0002044 [Deinococcus marmoris]